MYTYTLLTNHFTSNSQLTVFLNVTTVYFRHQIIAKIRSVSYFIENRSKKRFLKWHTNQTFYSELRIFYFSILSTRTIF